MKSEILGLNQHAKHHRTDKTVLPNTLIRVLNIKI